MPGFQLAFIMPPQEQGGERIFVDQFIILSGGALYLINYLTPESLYQQNLPYRDSILSSISVGKYYDTITGPNIKSIRASAIKILTDEAKFYGGLATQGFNTW